MKWIDINESLPKECLYPNLLLRVIHGDQIVKDTGFLRGNVWYWGVMDYHHNDIEVEDPITHWIYLCDIPEPQLKEI